MASNENKVDQGPTRSTGAIRKTRRNFKRTPQRRDEHSARLPNHGYRTILDVNERKEICLRERIKLPEKSSEPYHCTLCFYTCQTWNVVEWHICQDHHQGNLSDLLDQEKSLKLPKPKSGHLDCINTFIEELEENNGLTMLERVQRQLVVTYLNERLNTYVDGCTLHLYGSSLAGGLKGCDLNLNLTVPSEKSLSDTMKEVVKCLEDNPDVKNIKFDFRSDFPKILFDCKYSNSHCVMCVNLRNAVDTALLLSRYEDLDYRVRPLLVMFRLWAKECSLDSSGIGTLPAYAFSIMVIFYLQQLEDPVLPVIHNMVLRELDTVEFTEDELFHLRSWKSWNSMTVSELWLGLLRFYLYEFESNKRTISICTRGEVPRALRRWNGRGFAIEDPYLQKKNLGRHMNHAAMCKYLMHCLHCTYKYFTIPQTAKGPLFHYVSVMPQMTFASIIARMHAVLKDPMFKKTHGYLSDVKRRLRKVIYQNISLRDLTNEFEGSGTDNSLITVCPFQAEEMCERLKVSYILYNCGWEHFTNGKELPKVCTICRGENHLKTECRDDELPSLQKLPCPSSRFLSLITDVCEYTHKQYSLTEENYKLRLAVMRFIGERLKDTYADIQLRMFGSSCNGFGLLTSDIDICVTFSHNISGEGISVPIMVRELAKSLVWSRALLDLVPVTTAKVPVLKFHHRPTGLDGDLSVYNVLGEANTRLLKAYADIDIRAKILGLVMKRFAKLCGIGDASKGSLSSYAYILLVIHFLQQCEPAVLPVLQQLGDEPRIKMVQNRNLYFFDDLSRLQTIWPDFGKNNTSVGELWIQLFRYYTEKFDLENWVVSIRQQAVLLRKDKFWSSTQLAIEDPFDLEHNLAANLNQRMHTFIMRTFRKARIHFGYPRCMQPYDMNQMATYFFSSVNLNVGSAPYSGCHNCGKFGHFAKACPDKKRK